MEAVGLPEQACPVMCGVTAKILTEAGVIEARCTLEAHKGKKHYDSAFGLEWSSA